MPLCRRTSPSRTKEHCDSTYIAQASWLNQAILINGQDLAMDTVISQEDGVAVNAFRRIRKNADAVRRLSCPVVKSVSLLDEVMHAEGAAPVPAMA